MEYDFSEEKLNKVEEEDIILEGDQDLKNNQKLINEEREEKEENNNINIDIDNEEKENEQNDNQILRNMPNKEKKEGFKERINIDIDNDEIIEFNSDKDLKIIKEKVNNKKGLNKGKIKKFMKDGIKNQGKIKLSVYRDFLIKIGGSLIILTTFFFIDI